MNIAGNIQPYICVGQLLTISECDSLVKHGVLAMQRKVNEFGKGVVTGIVIDPTNSDVMCISKKKTIFKTVDGGLVWAEIGTGLENITDAHLIWDMAEIRGICSN